MGLITIHGEWDVPQPDESAITDALMQAGIYNIEVEWEL